MPPSSFRFQLTMDTFGLDCILPTTRADQGRSPLATCAIRRTEKKDVHHKRCNALWLIRYSNLYAKQFAAVTPLSTSISALHYHRKTDEFSRRMRGSPEYHPGYGSAYHYILLKVSSFQLVPVRGCCFHHAHCIGEFFCSLQYAMLLFAFQYRNQCTSCHVGIPPTLLFFIIPDFYIVYHAKKFRFIPNQMYNRELFLSMPPGLFPGAIIPMLIPSLP